MPKRREGVLKQNQYIFFIRTGSSICGLSGSTDQTPDAPPVGSAVFLDVNNGWCGQSGTVNYSVIAFRFELGT